MKRENWIKWDLDSRQDLETRWYLRKFTNRAQAYGLFLYLVEELYNSSDNKLLLEGIFLETASEDMGIPIAELTEAIAKLIEAKIFGSDGLQFWSLKVNSEVVKRDKLSDARSEAGRQGGLKKAEKSINCYQLPSDFYQNQAKSTTKEERRSEKIREDHINTKRSRAPVVTFEFPKTWDEKTRSALNDWVDFRKAKRKPVTQASINKTIEHYASDPERLAAAIIFTIRKDWQGLADDPEFIKTRSESSKIDFSRIKDWSS